MRYDLPEIEPGEAIMATIGIAPVFSRQLRKITAADLRDAANIGKTIGDLATKLIEGGKFRPPSGDLKYGTALRALTKPITPEALEEVVSAFPRYADEAASMYIVDIQKAREYLDQKLPKSTYKTAAGEVSLEPNDVATFTFLDEVNVLDDPLSIFGAIAQAYALKTHVDVLRAAYPTLCKAIDTAIVQATLYARARDSSYELPPDTEMGVAKWLGNASVSPVLSQALQASHVASQARKAKQDEADKKENAPGNGGSSPEAKDSLSAAQLATFAGNR